MKGKNAKAKTKANQETAEATESATEEFAAESVETNTDGETESAENTETASIANDIYVLMKNTNNIAVMDWETVLTHLGNDFSAYQLEQMRNGEIVIPHNQFIYSPIKENLEGIIADKGWTETASEDLTYEITDEEFVGQWNYDDFPSSDAFPMSDVPKGFQSDIPASEEIDELLSDPNQAIFDFYKNAINFGVEESLNKKETALIEQLIDGKKVVASLSENESKMWQKIQDKHAEFMSKATQQDATPKDADDQEPIENFRTPESLALAKAEKDDAIVGEVDLPMTDEEKAEFAEREKQILEAKETFESAPIVMSDNLAEIRRKRLFRETGKGFEEYVFDRFGIDNKYLFALTQVGDFRAVLSEIGHTPLQLASSVNANKKWAQDTNKIAKMLNVKTSDFEEMKPIIEAVSSIVSEVATDANGNLNSVAPRIFSAANDKIPEIIKSGMIEVGGEQMAIKDALALGEEVITETIKAQIIEVVAEGIKTQKQGFIDYIKESNERRTKAHEPQPPKKIDESKVFKGLVPSYSVTCSVHKIDDNRVRKVFNAGFELMCSCKYQLLIGSDELQCIESDGLFIQQD